jgi:hypothetical protein
MNSINMILTTEWVKVADGSITVDLQIKGVGVVLIGVGENKPTSTSGAYSTSYAAKIMPPLIGWARTGNSNGMPVDVTVTQ